MRLTVVLDCRDPDSLVEFWETALGYRLSEVLDEYRILVPKDGVVGPVFMLSASSDAKRDKNRMHVDVHPANADAHLTRLQRLGATLVHKDPDFDALKGIIKLHPLPPKPGKTT